MKTEDMFKTVSIDAMIDRHIGKKGTPERDNFENELRMDVLGETIKKARKAAKAETVFPNGQLAVVG